MEYIAFIHKEGSDYVAIVPDLNYTSSYGESFVETVHNIVEACELYCEELKVLPTARNLEQILIDEEIEKRAMPQLIEVKAQKNVRINIIIDTGILRIANEKASLHHNGNRSAYIQYLIASDAKGDSAQLH